MSETIEHPQPSGLMNALPAAMLGGGLLGALLLLVAEFTTLYEVRTSASSTVVKSVGTGSNHGYAMGLIAVVVAAFAIGMWRTGGRPALLAIGILGVIALLIALLGDLPDAQASGLVRSPNYVLASSSPSTGLYMETLGAVVLVITCVSGFLLIGPPARKPPRSGSGPRAPGGSGA